MSTELHAPYTARNSERWQPKSSSPAGISRAARITREREQKAAAAKRERIEVLAARQQEAERVAFEGTPMERGLHGIETELLGIAEAHNLTSMHAHYWRLYGMLNAALAFGSLSFEQVSEFRKRQSEAYSPRVKQLEGRLEK